MVRPRRDQTVCYRCSLVLASMLLEPLPRVVLASMLIEPLPRADVCRRNRVELGGADNVINGMLVIRADADLEALGGGEP